MLVVSLLAHLSQTAKGPKKQHAKKIQRLVELGSGFEPHNLLSLFKSHSKNFADTRIEEPCCYICADLRVLNQRKSAGKP